MQRKAQPGKAGLDHQQTAAKPQHTGDDPVTANCLAEEKPPQKQQNDQHTKTMAMASARQQPQRGEHHAYAGNME